MTAIENQIELASRLFQEKDWGALNQLIEYADAINNINSQLLYFKVIAMANLEGFRNSEALVELLKAHSNHPEDGGLYIRMLIDTLINREDYDDAIQYLLTALKKYPGAYEAYKQLSLCAEKKEDHALFDWASARYHYFLAKAHLEHFNIQEAAEGFEKALGFTNTVEDTHWFAAKAHAMIGDYEKALSYFQHIKAIPDLEKDLQQLRLDVLLRSRDLPATNLTANQLLEKDKANIEALRAKAFCKEHEGDLLAAIQQYHCILKYYPFDVMANLKAIQLSHLLIDQQNGITPSSDSQKLSIAMLMAEVGCDEASINMLASMNNNSQEYREVLFLVINRMITETDYQNAAKHLNSYLTKYPEDEDALVLYAKCLNYMDEWDKSIQIAESALRIDPNNIAASYQVAVAKYYLWSNGKSFSNDELEALTEIFIRFGQHAIYDNDSYFYAAQIFYALGNIDDMETFLSLAKDRGYVSGRASFLTGAYYQEYHFLDKAIEEYTHSIQLYSPSINYYPYYNRAQVALYLEDFTQAEQDVEVLLSHWPEDASALTLMNQLQEERNIFENGSEEDKRLLKLKKSGLEV